jgi:hypothetical protein
MEGVGTQEGVVFRCFRCLKGTGLRVGWRETHGCWMHCILSPEISHSRVYPPVHGSEERLDVPNTEARLDLAPPGLELGVVAGINVHGMWLVVALQALH